MHDTQGCAGGPEVVEIWSEDQLRDALARCAAQSLIVDLTRRGLAPFAAAHQVTAQIGETIEGLLSDLPPVLLPNAEGVAAEHIGSWIDFELFGDPARILADRVALRVTKHNPDRILILMPHTAEDLTRADCLLLARLAAMLPARISLGFSCGAYVLPDDLGVEVIATMPRTMAGAARFPPGSMSVQMQSKLALLGSGIPQGVAAPNGQIYLPPNVRFEGGDFKPDAVAPYAAQWGWSGLPFLIDSADAGTLARFAWRALAARDADLAIHLARLAVERPGDKAFATSALATILIIAQSFAELARIGGEDSNLNRAWGETLAGSAQGAASTFQAAADADDTSAMGLYLRNISALADFRVGKPEVALAKQLSIRAALEADPNPSRHLIFINNLNMGRLARAEGDSSRAAELIAAAFAARGEQVSEHDALYREVLLADVAETDDLAARHWAAAAEVFAAQTHPGAISMRAFRKLVSRPPRPFEMREIAVAEALRAHAPIAEGA
ncbi:hypothetical protein KUL25_00290 [Rhodobacteraceae bacterium N5(2021)]|uniref:Uncharacterized protein n=1 Tax=Gymnodinialimonas phycosphaerae TaxID=2841589 RepID=A0A975TVH3_9RHOB|nr:hypothetical protein [Gymnodinialimonas phycosphaerae]MBY4891198.1 hypothetical protein [Gymnodinialimonas phycosphaerae]